MLADRLAALAADPERLGRAADVARALGRRDAAARLADLVDLAHPRQRRQEGGRHEGSFRFPIGIIHFVGIGGIGMSGIAEILHNLGYKVQGSDQADNANVKRLRGMGIPVDDRPSRPRTWATPASSSSPRR